MNEMTITSAQYNASQNTDGTIDDARHNINATINGIMMNVPKDPANTDYAEIMRQVAAGTLTIADAD